MVSEAIQKQVIQMRELCKTSDERRDAGLPDEIPEVERFDNLSYGPDRKWNLLDVYLPKNRTKKCLLLSTSMAVAGVMVLKKLINFMV